MIDKALLRQQQPVAWKTLSSALKSGRVSHAYLFYGPKGTTKAQMALLFAQSLVCSHPDEDGFACQSCGSCRRMEREESMDFFWLHPGGIRSRKPLSKAELARWWKERQVAEKNPRAYKVRKEDILHLQDAFLATPASNERQTYLIEQYDQATSSASNALLKFLEEPKEGLTGILLCDSLSAVLPTIVSRCQLIPFRPVSRKALESELSGLIEDERVVSILASAGWTPESIGELLEDEALFELEAAAREYWKDRHCPGALTRLHTGALSSKKKVSRAGAKFFLDCLLHQLSGEPASLLNADLRRIVLEHLDALSLPVDPLLLIDRCAYEIWDRIRKER